MSLPEVHKNLGHAEPVEASEVQTQYNLVDVTIWYFHGKGGYNKRKAGKDFSLWVSATGQVVKSPYSRYQHYVGHPIQVAISDNTKTHDIHEIK